MAKNLFLFTGEESYLLHERVTAWKKAFVEKHGDINLAVLDAEETPLHEIMAAVNAVPFLGDKRLIFVYGLPEKPKVRQADKVTKKDEKREEELKKFEQDLDHIPETSVVVFVQSNPDKRKSFYKKLLEKAEVKEFIPLGGQLLNAWIRKHVEMKGARIDVSTADYFASLTGPNLWKLSQEIDKLTAYSFGKDITRSTIDVLAVPTLEANIFRLTDALGTKDRRKAIRHLHKSLAVGENLRQVFFMVVRQFRLLLQGNSYRSANPNASSTAFSAILKIHSFVARNILDQSKHFSDSELRSAYSRLLEIDTALKTSQIRVTADNQDELALALERFIIKFCS